MFRVLIAAVTLFVAQQAGAACVGADLLAEMPAQNRARLERAAAAQPFPNGLIWRAEKDDRVIHLVGTLHVADPRHTRTMQQITPLIERSKTIFLEVGNGDEARLQAKIARDPGVAFIVDGPTLPDLLPEADWQTLRRAMADRGVPGFLAAKMQPWMATVSLGMSKCAFQQALQKKPGLDQLILDHADAIGNPAQALEPFDTALGLFAAYTLEEQLDILRLSLTA
ncbi:MAG: TraB/GumN family protein, partial [Rhodobacter sp.]|nr:TraB/GumN family protein [Rhodobacter sp.]